MTSADGTLRVCMGANCLGVGLIWFTATSNLESRFFSDDGLWKSAPLLTGEGSFDPLPDVRNILVTGGEGFMLVL
jgi:hypothetical protein